MAHGQTRERDGLCYNFTSGKTKIHYEYKQRHKIKDYFPVVLVSAQLSSSALQTFPAM